MESLDNLKGYLEEYAELKKAEKNLKARMKELDPLIRPNLADRGEVIVGNSKFECVTKPGRATFDKKLLAEAHPEIDLDAYTKRGAPFTELRITEVEKIDD